MYNRYSPFEPLGSYGNAFMPRRFPDFAAANTSDCGCGGFAASNNVSRNFLPQNNFSQRNNFSPQGNFSQRENFPRTFNENSSCGCGKDSACDCAVFAANNNSPCCPDTALKILNPQNGQSVHTLKKVDGFAEAGARVKIRIDDHCLLETIVRPDSRWQIDVPYSLEDGQHTVYAISTQCCNANDFVNFTLDSHIKPPCPPRPCDCDCNCGCDCDCNCGCGCSCCDSCLPAPVITFPEELEIVNTAFPTITGRAFPGYSVDVCIEGLMCTRTTADENGIFSVLFQEGLSSGVYSVTAVQHNGVCAKSCVAHTNFIVELPPIIVPPPTVISPEDGAIITDGIVIFQGTSVPGYTVNICVSEHFCVSVPVDENGNFALAYPAALENGFYTATLTARSPECAVSLPVTVSFEVAII